MASFAEIHRDLTKTSFSSNLTFNKISSKMVQPKSDETLKTEFGKYMKNKILYQCIQECVKECDSDFAEKLEDTINEVKLKQYLQLGNQKLLGLNEDTIELSFQESEKLKVMLQKAIREKHTKLFADFKKITGKELGNVVKEMRQNNSLCDLSLSQNVQTLISLRQSLHAEQETFVRKVNEKSALLDELLNIRLKKVPEMCIQANRAFKAKIEINYLKCKIAEYKTKQDIFMEVPEALEAYQELLKDIKQQQIECEIAIEKLKELKVQYDSVQGKEYDEILKSYLMFKNSIEKLNKHIQL